MVIGGYRTGRGNRPGRIRSLLVGMPGEQGLEYAAASAADCARSSSTACWRGSTALAQPTPPFVAVPPEDAADAVWVRPEVVGEMEFAEWTSTGVARHPRWRGLRPDKSPDDVVREA